LPNQYADDLGGLPKTALWQGSRSR